MDKEQILSAARLVVEQEAAGVARLQDTLGDEFCRAVELMLNVKGRVIVSGMGKSGHVGAKIAATLASTGTPAQFVHPAEASHGDLGMITPNDVLLVLSNSGETAELANIIAYSRRFSVTMIGIAGRPQSTLLKQSDVALVLPDAPEACPIGLAPTTSTTMTLALGDALAVALMKMRTFSREGFSCFHPGGALGAQFKTVRDLMHIGDSLPTLAPDTPMGDVLITMSEKGFGIVGVIENKELIGVITDGDLRRNMVGLLERNARDVMTKNPKTISQDALAEDALAQMSGKVTSLFVVDDHQLHGLISIHDCLRSGVV